MTQTEWDGNQILLALLADLEVFAEIEDLNTSKTAYVEEVKLIGIPYRPKTWFGGPLSSARRKDYSRAIAYLEIHGLVTCSVQPRRDRVTHLRLTPAGLRQAIQLAEGHVDLKQLAQALAWIDWAEDLWSELDSDLVR